MLELAGLASTIVYPLFCTFLGLCSLYLYFAKFLWTEDAATPSLYYQVESRYMEQVVKKCKAIQDGYHPVFLWGQSGHLQTMFFGSFGHMFTPRITGTRHCVLAADGSTIYYDVYEPKLSESQRKTSEMSGGRVSPYTFFVVPGINNSSESNYIRGFSNHATNAGFRVIVFNHLGVLKSEKLTANRIFTYGGTGDISLVFKDICKRYPQDTLVGCGFSLGACILIRFLGEHKERREKFLCAISLCQGYDAYIHMLRIQDWKKLRRLYSLQISRGHKNVILRHSDRLIPNLNDPLKENDDTITIETSTENRTSELKNDGDNASLPNQFWNGFTTEITHDGHNSNGCSLDSSKCQAPDEGLMASSNSIVDLDEAYTRRVLGFSSIGAMYRWVSCVDLMDKIDNLPLLTVNAIDDPCILVRSHKYPKKHAQTHPKSLFVQTKHGGHLGFFEGRGIWPNKTTWLDRLILDFAQACVE